MNARRLFSGILGTGFPADVEAQYRVAVLQEQRASTIACAVAATTLWILFAGIDLIRFEAFGANDRKFWILFLSRWSVVIGLGACLYALYHNFERYDLLVLPTYILLGLAASITSNVAKSMGAFAVDTALVAIIMAAFLPLGLMFREALIGAMTVTVIGMVCAVMLLPTDLLIEELQVLLTMNVALLLAALGGYLRERSDRAKYLLKRLLQDQAATDHLTGLPNRRQFELHVERALLQCRREASSAMLAIVDVDYFKRFNDTYGHREGDITLRRVASTMRTVCQRPLDIAGRLGGEEFGIFLYGSDPSRLATQLTAMVDQIAGLRIEHAGGIGQIVTISCGAAAFDGREVLEVLYRRADEALYEAKKSGRNRLCVAPAVRTAPAIALLASA